MNYLIFLQQLLSTKLRKKQRWAVETLIAYLNEAVEVVMLRDFNKLQSAISNEFNPYMSEYRVMPYDSADRKAYEAAFKGIDDHVQMPSPIERKVSDEDEEDEEGDDANDLRVERVKTLISIWEELAPKLEREEAKEYAQKRIEVLKNLFPVMEALAVVAAKSKSSTTIKREKELAEVRGAMHPEVRESIDVIAEDFRKVIEANWYNHFLNLVKLWKKESEEKGSTDLDKMYPGDRNDKRKNHLDAQMRSNLSTVLTCEPYYETKYGSQRVAGYNYSPMTDEALRTKAYKKSVYQIAGFKYKMAFKLGGMFPKSLLKVTAEKLRSRNEAENEIIFNINDGESRFLIKNQIVQVWSSRGNPFHRYPTTFHNAFVKGEKIGSPDEYRVKKILNNAYGN